MRDAADAAVRSLSSFQVEIFQNEDLYRRVHAVRPTAPAETQFRKDLVESFEDTGVTLPADRRARAKAIADQLTALAQEFARNLRDNQTRMAFAPAEMLGLPEPISHASRATPRDGISSRSTTPTSIPSWRTPSRRARGAATTSGT